jgi:hypothetical protein
MVVCLLVSDIHDELPSRVVALHVAFEACRGRGSAAPRKRGLQAATRAVDDQRPGGSYTLKTSSCRRSTRGPVLRNAASVLGHVLGIHTLPERKILHAVLDGPVDRRSQLSASSLSK